MYQSRHLFQLLLEQLLLRLRVGFSRCLSKRSRAVLGWSGKRFQPKVTLRIEIIHSGNVILFVIGKWWVLVAGIRSINQYWMERELQAINLASHLGYSNTFRIDVSSMTPNLREEPCKIWHHVSYGARRSLAVCGSGVFNGVWQGMVIERLCKGSKRLKGEVSSPSLTHDDKWHIRLMGNLPQRSIAIFSWYLRTA